MSPQSLASEAVRELPLNDYDFDRPIMSNDVSAQDNAAFVAVKELLHRQKDVAFAADTSCYVVDASDKEVNLQQAWQERQHALASSGLKCVLPMVWESEVLKFTERSVTKWLSYTLPNFNSLEHDDLKSASLNLQSILRACKFRSREIASGLWQKYKSRSKMIIAATPNNCLPDVLQRYASAKPPFDIKGKKSHEFPDAFALAALEDFSLSNSGIKIVVASKDGTVLEYCKQSRHLIGFQSIERALEALTGKDEIERLLRISREITERLRQDPDILLLPLSQSLQQLRQLTAYNGNTFHPNIPAPFQPYIRIETVLAVSLLESPPHGLIVRVQSENEGHVSMTGRAEFRVLATGRVSARAPASNEPPSMEINLFDPREFSFQISFNAHIYRSQQREFWDAMVDDEGKRLFELPEPPADWIATPHA